MALFVHEPLLLARDFRLFQELMYDKAGISLPDSKQMLVRSRLRRRVTALGLASYGDYHRYLCTPGHGEELQLCIDALTTNETFFFRHKVHWDFIRTTVIPSWLEAAKGQASAVFHAWSAACSSGEEAYSLAILLHETLGRQHAVPSIDGTDINAQVIERARQADYGPYALQKVTPACLASYFVGSGQGGRYRIQDSIRSMVNFRQQNLQERQVGVAYDLILLRNVMIYFDAESKRRVVYNALARLRQGAYLMVGGAETLSEFPDALTYIRPTIYQKR